MKTAAPGAGSDRRAETPAGPAGSPDDAAWARAVAAALGERAADLRVIAPAPGGAPVSSDWHLADVPMTAEGPSAALAGEDKAPERLVLRCHDAVLGAIDVQVDRTAGGLRVVIGAENAAASLLQSERTALTHALEARGLGVASLSIGQNRSDATPVGTAVAKHDVAPRWRAERARDDRRSGGGKRRKLDIMG